MKTHANPWLVLCLVCLAQFMVVLLKRDDVAEVDTDRSPTEVAA